jgi:decaprenyl-phosphate phosphoribosyltransferase
MTQNTISVSTQRASASALVGGLLQTLKHYASMARPDYWTKQVFLAPGFLLAASVVSPSEGIALRALVGLAAVCLAASANYVINEWLDRKSDMHHPHKRNRPAPQGLVRRHWVLLEYLLLAGGSLYLGAMNGDLFILGLVLLIFSGALYNVPPIRLKDLPYVDIISESFNNALRLFLGWVIYSGNTIPPVSVIFIFWLGGAFLMSMKRYAEYRTIVASGAETSASDYRRSFRHYNEARLLIFSVWTALMTAFGSAIFIVKYKPEMLLLFPLGAVLITYYFACALRPNSIVQSPEHLHKDRGLVVLSVLTVITFVILLYVEIPLIELIVYSGIPIFKN